MATYFVSSTGSNSNNGTSTGTPWQTLAKALDTAAGGDTVKLMGSGVYAATMTSQATSRSSAVVVTSNGSDSPKLGAVDLTNVDHVTFSGLTFNNQIAWRSGCDHMTLTGCTSAYAGGTTNQFGILLIRGEGGTHFTITNNVWADLTWNPTGATNPNGGDAGTVAIQVNPNTTPCPTDFTITGNVFRNLVGFDGIQFSVARFTHTPGTTDYFENVLIEGNEMDNVSKGNTTVHADALQLGGYFHSPIVRRNFVHGGGRGFLFLPNDLVVNGSAVYYGCIHDLLVENNVVVDVPSSYTCRLDANNPNAVIRHNTFLLATPTGGASDGMIMSAGVRPGDESQAATANVTFVNNIVNEINVAGSLTYAAKKNNQVGTIYNGTYTRAATDLSGSASFQDAANAVQPRQLEDFLLTGGSARNGADTSTAYTVADDARGFARSGSKDIGALDVDAGSGAITDTTAPTVAVTSPLGGGVSGVVTLGAAASDNVGVVGVQFKVDGSDQGSEDTTTPYSTAWDTTGLTAGTSHTITAVARDAAGNTTTSSTVTVTIADTLAPSVSVTSPAHGATIAAGVTALTATASDDVGVSGVQFTVDGVNKGSEDVSAPFTGSWDASAAVAGSQHTIRAVARDAAGNVRTSQGNVVTITGGTPDPTPDPPPPTVAPDTGAWGVRL